MDNRQHQRTKANDRDQLRAEHSSWMAERIASWFAAVKDIAETIPRSRLERRAGPARFVDGRPVGTHTVHDYAPRMVRGRWVASPYRNPDRAAKLAKSGRLRVELREETIEHERTVALAREATRIAAARREALS